MQCLILAGGPGTRMRPMSWQTPKSLLPVNGVPFAHHQLLRLAAEGVRRVVYSIGYLGSMISGFVGGGERFGLQVLYVDEGDSLLGSAGAIRLAIDQGVMDETFMVLYGDSYPIISLPLLLRAALYNPFPTMAVLRNEGRWDNSNVIFKDGMIALYEKGRKDQAKIGMNHIDYGVSVLNKRTITERVAAGEKADLADIFHDLSIKGRLCGHEVNQRFYEVGSMAGLKELEEHLGKY